MIPVMRHLIPSWTEVQYTLMIPFQNRTDPASMTITNEIIKTCDPATRAFIHIKDIYMKLSSVVTRNSLRSSAPSERILILNEVCFLNVGVILTIRKNTAANGSAIQRFVEKYTMLNELMAIKSNIDVIARFSVFTHYSFGKNYIIFYHTSSDLSLIDAL